MTVIARSQSHKSFVDLEKNELRNPRLQQLGADISGPVDGLFFYRTDTHKIRVRINGAWQDLATMADVTAGGISSSIVDAKGDLIVGTADDTVARKAVGTNGQALFADSAQGDGLVWRLIEPGDVSGFDTQVRTSRLDQMAAPTGPVSFNGQKITNLATGTAANDAVNLAQLQGAVEGRAWKDTVDAATTANITLSGTQTIDGVALVAGDRVLVKNQSAPAENGIYVVAAGAWARADDVNTAAEINDATVLVDAGSTLKGKIYTQTATVTTLGTDAVTWTVTGDITVYTADDTSLELVGTQFRIKDEGVTAAKIATSAVGTGLTGGAGSPLAVDTATVVRKYATTIGDGAATSFTITHNLNTRDVTVSVYLAAGTFEEVEVDVRHATVNTVTIIFTGVVPANNEYRVVVHG